jgi:hypothetical protein
MKLIIAASILGISLIVSALIMSSRSVGRYEVRSASRFAIKCDTKTGQTWEWQGSKWEKIPK